MGEIWFWMSGDSMKFSRWSHNSMPHQFSSPCGSMDVVKPHWWAARSCDKHLNFICQSGEQLHLTSNAFPNIVPYQHTLWSPVGGVGTPQRVAFNSYTTAGTG